MADEGQDMIPLLWLRSLLAAYWRPLLIGLAVLLIVGGFSHWRYSAGEAHGRAAVEALWQADKQAARLAYAKAQAATQATIDADRKAAQETESALLAKLRDADTAGRTLAGRLRDYQARRCSGPVPAAPTAAGSVPPTVGSAERDAKLERLAGAIRESQDRLIAACAKEATVLQEVAPWWDGVAGNR